MGVTVTVVADGRHVDRLLGDGEVDPVRAARGRGGRRRLQRGERLADVAPGEADEMVLGVGRQGERAAQPALVGHRAAQQAAYGVVVEGLEGEQHAAGQQR
ncbi:hypothetical protein B0E53_05890 [Micromonospora sp. MH33]|nr:hypothetical protein B0E53_05890 [Micromonospora sp. MH33]